MSVKSTIALAEGLEAAAMHKEAEALAPLDASSPEWMPDDASPRSGLFEQLHWMQLDFGARTRVCGLRACVN